MSRIFEHQGASEETVVSRVLLSVHQAIDEQFPNASAASRQFTKTVFSDENVSTALNQVAPGTDGGDSRRTSAEQLEQSEHTNIPAPPTPARTTHAPGGVASGDNVPAAEPGHNASSGDAARSESPQYLGSQQTGAQQAAQRSGAPPTSPQTGDGLRSTKITPKITSSTNNKQDIHQSDRPLSEVPASQIGSSAGTQMQRLSENKGSDWTLRITLAMLLASILLLLYVVLN